MTDLSTFPADVSRRFSELGVFLQDRVNPSTWFSIDSGPMND